MWITLHYWCSTAGGKHDRCHLSELSLCMMKLCSCFICNNMCVCVCVVWGKGLEEIMWSCNKSSIDRKVTGGCSGNQVNGSSPRSICWGDSKLDLCDDATLLTHICLNILTLYTTVLIIINKQAQTHGLLFQSFLFQSPSRSGSGRNWLQERKEDNLWKLYYNKS